MSENINTLSERRMNTFADRQSFDATSREEKIKLDFQVYARKLTPEKIPPYDRP